MRRGRNHAYCTCEVNRRHSGLVPRTTTRAWSTSAKTRRARRSLRAWARSDPKLTAPRPRSSVGGFELDGIKNRIRRLVTNLEAQEPDSEIADDIRARLEELAGLRAKRQRALEAAERERAQVPDPESAEAFVDALPLLEVDWELVSDNEFRDLLAALNFEASYDPTKRELTIRVTLVPDLTDPGGGRALPLCSCPRQDSNLRTALRRRVLYPLSYGGRRHQP